MKPFRVGVHSEDRRKPFLLPPAVVTASVGIFGITGSGKSSVARMAVEGLVSIKLPVTIFDPKGDWWGITSSADGKKPGLPFVILGGDHGHVDIKPEDGERIADFILDNPGFYIIDLSDMRKAQQRRFYTDCAERIYFRKKKLRDPMMIVVDEADWFAPQNTFSDKGDYPAARMVGASEDLVRRGRQRGIGSMWPTQRPASLHTGVRSQVNTLIVMRLAGIHDMGAIDDWVKSNGTKEQRDEMMANLAALDTGVGYVWSPHFLKVFARVAFDIFKTFDSFATPEPGMKMVDPKVFASVDLDALKIALAEQIEQAKANDPRALQKRVRELERELLHAHTRIDGHECPVADAPEPEIIEKPKMPEIVVELLADLGRVHAARDEEIGNIIRKLGNVADNLGTSKFEAMPPGHSNPKKVTRPRPTRGVVLAEGPPPKNPPPKARPHLVPDAKLGKGHLAVLGVLAEWPDGLEMKRLAFLAGYSAKASTLGVYVSELRKWGLLKPPANDGLVIATPEGLDEVGGVKAPLKGDALLQKWLRHPRMGEGHRKVLAALIEEYPNAVSHEELCEITGYSPEASTIGVYISELRKLGLIEKGQRRVPDEFMEAIR